jgi:hypothetical protein
MRLLPQAKAQNAVPYDVPDVVLTHEGLLCSFDAFVKKYDLRDESLHDLAIIVRGADMARLDLAPQCAGLFDLARPTA